MMTDTEIKICQSCAMPLGNADLYGTNADGSKNEDYCTYCYQNGTFTSEQTMGEMIETCIPFISKGDPYPDEETARKAMNAYFPELKRWKKQVG